jgi:predicted nucleic acid-binding protein
LTPVDTGPLVALVNTGDSLHAICNEALDELPDEPLVTTWPCITEAMYLLHREGGYAFVDELWQLIESGDVVIHDLTTEEILRMRELMSTYRDTPMDLADASLVAAMEAMSERRVFTTDSHFYAYRTVDGGTFEVFPPQVKTRGRR